MNRTLTILFVLTLGNTFLLFSQSATPKPSDPISPGFMHVSNEQALFPNQEAVVQAAEARSGGVVTIPVVIHVIHRVPPQNISDAQIHSQMDVLNEDYRRLNPDTTNTPAAFQGVAADTEIEFCLASQDPQGNPTTGIVRTATTVFAIGSETYYSSAAGGSDAWDPERYLNIYVCEMSPGLIASTLVPQMPLADGDGIVITPTAFGTTGNAQPPFNYGRVLTREVGLYLGLRSLVSLSCSDVDNIADTPTTDQFYVGCPTFPQTSCGSDDMFMNFMEATDGNCKNMFTIGQAQFMHATLNSYRPGLATSIGCTAVGVEEGLSGPDFTVSPVPAHSEMRLDFAVPAGVGAEVILF
ncbi:MAG: M43 family zinc metalloprotease, partial [Bacteroidota bacterium]